MASSWQDLALRVLWYGGSTFDAWLNIVAAKIASRLLSFPQLTAQLGLPSAIVFQLVITAMGLWTHSIINLLYLKHKETQAREVSPSERNQATRGYTTQLHDVIGGLLGPRWKLASLVFNIATVFYISSIQLIACCDIAYSANNRLDKRTWTFVFGAIFSLTIFIPSAHNYRVWSFISVITIIYDSVYMTVATLLHKKAPNVTHSSPRSYEDYFTGLVGLLIIGNVPIPVEIMDAMWKPHKYQGAYLYGTICIALLVMIPSISMDRKFGDKLLTIPNAMVLFPRSSFRDTAYVLMIFHLFISFGMFSSAVYAMWEKLLRVHDCASYGKRTLSRVPVFLAFWVTALVTVLAVPFYGTINKLFDAVFATWNFSIIPCAAYIAVFWPADQRRRSKSFSGLGWTTDFMISFVIILWMLLVECGLGLWADVHSFINLEAKPFANCYGC